MTQTVIGVFDTPRSACLAGDALVEQGIDDSSIYFSVKEGSAADSGLKEQPLSAIRRFLGELFGSEDAEEADCYLRALSRGGVLLSVDVPDDSDVDTICDVIEDAGAEHLEALPEADEDEDEEEDEDEDEDEEASPKEDEEDEEEEQEPAEQRDSVPVIEEETRIGKRQVKGRTRVIARMVETPVREDVTLRDEHATVRRRPVDEPVSPEEVERLADATIEVEETTEKPVVRKRARIVEEVELGTEASERVEIVEDSERHTEIEVEREREPAARKSKSRTTRK